MDPNSVFRSDILAGQVALITGGGTGICRGIAEAYAAHGADLALVSRSLDHLAPTAEAIAAETGRRCIPLVADVRDPEAVDAAVRGAVEALGRLDILVNGAAGNFLSPAATLKARGFKTVMEIDALGTFHVCRAAYDAWLGAHGGQILNISATLHYGATAMQLHASAAKAAVDALTRNLALEWGPLGIRVNAIAPGPIGDTEGMRRLAPGDFKERLERRIPLGRFGRIREIADMALFLASPAASYCNGGIFVVDGGAWLSGNALDL